MIMIMIKLWNLKVDDAETEDFKLLPNYIIASTTDCMQKEMYTIQKKRLFVVERMTNLR